MKKRKLNSKNPKYKKGEEEKLVVLKVTMVASPNTLRLMNEALSLLTLLVENTKSLDTAGPQIEEKKIK